MPSTTDLEAPAPQDLARPNDAARPTDAELWKLAGIFWGTTGPKRQEYYDELISSNAAERITVNEKFTITNPFHEEGGFGLSGIRAAHAFSEREAYDDFVRASLSRRMGGVPRSA